MKIMKYLKKFNSYHKINESEVKYDKSLVEDINEKLGFKINIDYNQRKELLRFINQVKKKPNIKDGWLSRAGVGNIFYRIIVSIGDSWKDEVEDNWSKKINKEQYKEIIDLFNLYKDTKIVAFEEDHDRYYHKLNDNLNLRLYSWSGWIGNQRNLLYNAFFSFHKKEISVSDFNHYKDRYNREKEILKIRKSIPNTYYTIEKDPENIKKFVKNILDLDQQLINLSLKKSSTIMWKTQNSFDGFMRHNDNLKFYYYDSILYKDVDIYVNNWAKKFDIKISDNRTHKQGFDTVVEIKGETYSYGELLSFLLERRFTNHIIENSNKSDEDLLKDIESNIENVIKQASTLLNSKEDIISKLEKYLENYPKSLFERGYFN